MSSRTSRLGSALVLRNVHECLWADISMFFCVKFFPFVLYMPFVVPPFVSRRLRQVRPLPTSAPSNP